MPHNANADKSAATLIADLGIALNSLTTALQALDNHSECDAIAILVDHALQLTISKAKSLSVRED